ncbi:MAG: hypothetical protein B7Y02_08850, partial [Rhodobacterales bacterium 17-64-5]
RHRSCALHAGAGGAAGKLDRGDAATAGASAVAAGAVVAGRCSTARGGAGAGPGGRPGAGRSCDAGSAASGHHRPGRGEPKPRRQGRGVGPHAIPRDRGATGQPTAQSRASP